MKKRFRFRLYPSREEENIFTNTFGCKRFIWNTLLASNIEQLHLFNKGLITEKPKTSNVALINSLNSIKLEHEWLYNVPAVALQQVAIDLAQAFSHFFRLRGFPQFKNKHNKQSFRLVGTAFDIRNNKLL